jgi:transposase InsO family protein
MPWKESSPVSERLRFVQACVDRRLKIVEICQQFGISEKTGQKVLARFREFGEAGLAERSSARVHQAHRMSAATAARIIALRRQHPLYGAALLRDWLIEHEPGHRWPAASTIGDLLKREGLIRARRRQHGAPQARLETGRTIASAPNVVWTADFKGQSRLGSGAYCYPLTVLDLHSHFLLRCTALETTAVASSRRVFERLFTEYGLPDVLRTDNGVPFAQPNALGRMGALAFWWVRLGIRPEHTRPATPSDNGAHERFHRTLKAHTMRPCASSFGAQQRRFDRFAVEYNTERPHTSAPDRHPPGHAYQPSARPYSAKLPPLLYAGADAVRHVDSSGFIKWRSQPVFLSGNLAGEDVGLTTGAADQLRISYADLILGEYDPHTKRFTPNARWAGDKTPHA